MTAPALERPRFSFTAYCTPHNDAFDDIRDAVATGADGIGLSELKIETGRENELHDAMEQAGLVSTFCVPRSHTLLGMPFGPASQLKLSLQQRVDMIAASIERLARFNPVAIVIAPGATGDPIHPAGPVEDVYEALPIIADVAAEFGQQIAFELLGQRRGSAISTIPDMVAVMDAINRPNVGLALDNFHSWPEEGLYEHIHEHIDRVIAAQVCDVRIDERSGLDREMPGLGRATAVPWVANLLDAGYRGWWEFEVFSDDGTFGNDFPDSYWHMPHAEFLRMGRQHFETVWQEATDLAAAMQRRSRGR
ncbi:sugar phosphate isomerase/epimerase family protein [Dactylosporangium sp. NPDC051484]|uniref:sugar phosphate isomerase/epimerase family protein n=1 Tax=Dactylosporangium sp. NPDC051484 TaxID=3154942 RepID=UPI00345070A3